VPKARSGHSLTQISGGGGNSYIMYGGIMDSGVSGKIHPTQEIYRLNIRGGKSRPTSEKACETAHVYLNFVFAASFNRFANFELKLRRPGLRRNALETNQLPEPSTLQLTHQSPTQSLSASLFTVVMLPLPDALTTAGGLRPRVAKSSGNV